ncbi:hypothetical protein GCM10010261_66350 [Streptomyces pilosus]|nr:hypothetical protein GCM10010261_66350 [Streptomyces pilosus]
MVVTEGRPGRAPSGEGGPPARPLGPDGPGPGRARPGSLVPLPDRSAWRARGTSPPPYGVRADGPVVETSLAHVRGSRWPSIGHPDAPAVTSGAARDRARPDYDSS